MSFCYCINYVFSVLYNTELNKEWWGEKFKADKAHTWPQKILRKKSCEVLNENTFFICAIVAKKEGEKERKNQPYFSSFYYWVRMMPEKNLDSLFHLGSNIILINTSKFAIPVFGIQKPMLGCAICVKMFKFHNFSWNSHCLASVHCQITKILKKNWC